MKKVKHSPKFPLKTGGVFCSSKTRGDRSLKSNQQRRLRQGLSSVIVIGFVVVIFILFTRMVFMLKQEAHMASHFHKRAVLANLADAGASCGLNALDVILQDPQNPIFKKLTDPTVVGGGDDLAVPIMDIYPAGAYPIDCLDKILADTVMQGSTLHVQAVVRYLRHYANPFPDEEDPKKRIKAADFTPNDKEKEGFLEIVATATLGKYKQVVREQRKIKVTCNALPVTSRFSLFIQKPYDKRQRFTDQNEKKFFESDYYSTDLNRVYVSESKDTPEEGKPLVIASRIKNHEKGWIFLGGGDKPETVLYNVLASGATKIGEGHYFEPDMFKNDGRLPHESDKFKGIYSKLNGLTNTPYPTKMTNSPSAQNETAGIFETGHCKELMDMCKNPNPTTFLNLGQVIPIFNYDDNKKDKSYSSIFRLFGTPHSSFNNVVDTNRKYVIMGNVWKVNSNVGLYQFDPNTSGGGWNITGFFPYLPDKTSFQKILDTFCQRGDQEAAQSNSPGFISQYHFLVNALNAMKIIEPDTSRNSTQTSSSSQVAVIYYKLVDNNSLHAYSKYMSQVTKFPFFYASNWVAEHITSICKQEWKPAPKNEFASILPDKTNNVFMKTEREYKKSLNFWYLPRKHFIDRCTIKLDKDDAANQFKDLFDEHFKGGELDWGLYVYVKGDIDLPTISKVKRGGVIVVDGNVTVHQIGNAPPADGDTAEQGNQLLTIVSLGGTMKVKARKIHASLVALGMPDQNGKPKGEIVLESPIELFGNLVAGNIKPSNFVNHGGILTYNQSLSPEYQDNPASYLGNDNAYCINLDPHIFRWTVSAE